MDLPSLPGFGFSKFTLKEGTSQEVEKVKKNQGEEDTKTFRWEKKNGGGLYISNPFFEIELNARGEFVSFVDLRENRELLAKGSHGNVYACSKIDRITMMPGISMTIIVRSLMRFQSFFLWKS